MSGVGRRGGGGVGRMGGRGQDLLALRNTLHFQLLLFCHSFIVVEYLVYLFWKKIGDSGGGCDAIRFVIPA